MENTIIKSIKYSPQEYLEVVLHQPLNTEVHVYHLSTAYLLNCFIHLSSPSILYFDTQNYVTFKYYVSHHPIKKNDLKEWCLFLIDHFEQEQEGYFLCHFEHVFIDEKSKKLMLCKVPQHRSQDIDRSFVQMMLDVYECMNYEDDEEWISQMYLLLRQKPFRINLFRQFLMSKKTKKWLSFFRKEEDDLSDFFQMMHVQESVPIYGMTTLPFETQVLMAGYQYGYFIDQSQKKILITSSPWTIGRQKDCHFVYDFPEVSKLHCKVMIEKGCCYIEDQGSTNGTSVNGERLLPFNKHLLKDHDILLLAGHQLTYYV